MNSIDILEEQEKGAIEELKKVRWNSLAVVVKNEDGNMDISYFTEKHKKTILNLIENLIAENKELKEENQRLNVKIIDLYKYSIPKSKVEEKIQELEKDIEIYSNYEEDWAKIKVLQSLLGKE